MKNLTLTEKKAKLEELKAAAETLAAEYNEADAYYMALAAGEEPEGEEPRKLSAVMADIKKAEGDYKTLSMDVLYDECRASSNPMQELIKRLTYTTISAKPVKPDGVPDADYTVLSVAEGSAYVDIIHFGNAIKTATKWFPRLQRLNHELHNVVSKRVKGVTGTYVMSAEAASLDMGKNPCADKNLQAILQTIADEMLGKDVAKLEARDAGFIRETYASTGRGKNAVKCQGDKEFALTMARMLNRVITKCDYVIESKNYTKK